MQQLIYFLKRYRNLLYFIFLQIIAIILTVNNFTFHKSKFINSSNYLSGKIYDTSSEISDFIKLRSTNNILAEENRILKTKLETFNSKNNYVTDTVTDSIKYRQRYEYISGKVRKNEFLKINNFLTINLGESAGVNKEMAVINDNGIVGVIDATSSNYSRVQSILNKKSKINARFKNNFYFGSLTWDGENHNIVQLTDIPRQAIYKKGDTIITGGKSTIFPEGILIGTVAEVPEKLTASNTLSIKLFNDMANLGYIYVVKSYDKIEIESLE